VVTDSTSNQFVQSAQRGTDMAREDAPDAPPYHSASRNDFPNRGPLKPCAKRGLELQLIQLLGETALTADVMMLMLYNVNYRTAGAMRSVTPIHQRPRMPLAIDGWDGTQRGSSSSPCRQRRLCRRLQLKYPELAWHGLIWVNQT
jgi:hypothetical protein